MSHSLLKVIAPVTAFGLALSSTSSQADEINVVASINPIHSLVSAVMKGVGEPKLLVRGGASPHDYALRPSEARSLQNADIVFWVGEDIETFLRKPLSTLPKSADVAPFIKHEEDEHKEHEDHEHEDHNDHVKHDDHAHENHEAHEKHDDHAHEDDHDHDHPDLHVWLSPKEAIRLVWSIEHRLAERDPANHERYKANAVALAGRLKELDHDIEHKLDIVKSTGFVTFHDAYSYFSKRYGLNNLGSVTVNPETKPGAAKLKELRHEVVERGAVCVFSEPQFKPAIVDVITEGLNIKTGVLDPLGADIEPGPDAYEKLIRNMADGLLDCLKS